MSGYPVLRFRAGGPPFATLSGTSATVDLTTAGPSAGAAVRAVRDGFTVQGIVAADELSIGPARAVVIGGFVVPSPRARFAWKGTLPGTIEIGFALDAEIEVLPEAGLDRARLPCEEVSLEQPTFEPRNAAPRAPKEKEMLVRAGKVVPLSRTPEGPPVARLRATGDEVSVTLLQTRGGRALVRREVPEAIVFGWVPAADLQAPPGDLISDTFGIGDVGWMPTTNAGSSQIVRCDRDVALVVELAGERRTVGRVAARTTMPVRRRRDDFVEIILPEKLLSLERAARIGVLASHVAGCVEER